MRVTRGIKLLILIIIIAASALRLFDLFHIPFSVDELNFYLGLKNLSFKDFAINSIQSKSVSLGLDFLRFYMFKLVGFNEGWLKLPFILAGIASAYLTWKIGREWFSPAVGMLSATTIAFMQFPLSYSQLSLPYSSGMLFILIMLLGWSRIVLFNTEHYRYNFLLFVTGAILSAYNHIFSLVLILPIIIIGFFILNKKDLKNYVLAGILIITALIPYIYICFYQFDKAFINTIVLSVNIFYFLDFSKYFLGFSWVCAIFFASIILYGLCSSIICKKIYLRKRHLILLILVVISLFATLLLNENFSSENKFAVLLFSFPILIVLSFSTFEKLSIKRAVTITILWSLVLIHTLIFSRGHYHYFYRSFYEQNAKEIKAFTQTHPVDSILVIYTYNDEIAELYNNKFKLHNDLKVVNKETIDNKTKLYELLNDSSCNYAIIAESCNAYSCLYSIVHEYFPITIQETNYSQGACIIKQRGEPHYRNYLSGSLCDFINNYGTEWNFDNASVLKDTLNSEQVLKASGNTDNTLSCSINSDGFIKSPSNIIDAIIWVYLPDNFTGNAKWSLMLKSNSDIIKISETNINGKLMPHDLWIPVSSSISLPHVKNTTKNMEIFSSLNIEDNTVLFVKQAYVGVRNGNPAVLWPSYGILE
jgi:hypothetical protein